VEDELAPGGGGVDRLLEAAEPDAALSQPGDGVDQVAQGAAEAVEFPDDQGVAGAQLVQDLGEGGRSGRAPLAVSTNTREQPAAFSASTWSCGCWSVETRA
jgi:hypothetical protein